MPSEPPITRLFSRYSPSGGPDIYRIKAEQVGGTFDLTAEARERVAYSEQRYDTSVRRYIWERIRQGGVPLIDLKSLEIAHSLQEPTFETKAHDVLSTIRRHTPKLGQFIRLHELNIEPRIERELATILMIDQGYDNDRTDVTQISWFLSYLKEQDFIAEEYVGDGTVNVTLKPKGQIFLEHKDVKRSNKIQGFVAMWFSAETADAWEQGIVPGILGAGYTPYRVDQHHHENRIDDEIIAQIRRSRFLVADFTCGHMADLEGRTIPITRGGVFFEAGFAYGLGIPIIWAVRRDSMDGMHFDTRQYPHIVWDSPADLAKQLREKIEALIGQGPAAAATV